MLLNRRWQKRTAVKAVHEDDLESLLRSLQLFDSVVRGEVSCVACGSPVTLSSLGTIYSREGRVFIVCSAPACCAQALEGRD